MADAARIPVTLLCGIEAAARSRLARHWFQAAERDAWLAVAADAIAGCACCTGAVALRTLLVRRLRESLPQRVLIELDPAAHAPAVVDALRAPPFDRLLAVDCVVLAMSADGADAYL